MATKKLVSIEAKLKAIREDQWRRRQPLTIFRVPAYVRDSNRTAYEPRMVSIGPYYHGVAALRAMEEHKWRYLQGLLSRCDNDDTTVGSASTLLEEMRGLKDRALACYYERPVTPVGMDDDDAGDDFARMLLLDGCFILELFFRWHTNKLDKLCDINWVLTLVAADLLLMENQIPFFVLERLYGVVTGMQMQRNNRESLLRLLVEYIVDEEPLIREPSGDLEVNHLLHLYYLCYVPERPVKQAMIMQIVPSATVLGEAGVTFVKKNVALARLCECFMAPKRKPPCPRTIPRATELLEAGVTFVLGEAAREYRFDVTFDRRTGVMKIPAIEIDDMKRPLLVNLIAFEQTLGDEEPRLLTSYVALMSKLIVTARDVELLRQHRILESLLANDEEAARFFSRLGVGSAMNYELQAFAGLYEDVRRYCDSPWHRYRAALHRDYFSNPWSAISVVVAALLVGLTIMQSYFAVYPSKN